MKRLELSTDLLEAIRCQEPVLGLTHDFYKYPARFSPQLVRALIGHFTEPGDVVLDPFCGGATTLVEAAAMGRRAVGLDISPLAVFLSRVKTWPLDAGARARVLSWAETSARLNLRTPLTCEPERWRELGYQRHLGSQSTWPIRKSIELLLERVHELREARLREFGRCAVLRTGQWALDGRRNLPSASEFRIHFLQRTKEMLDGMAAYASAREGVAADTTSPVCMLGSAVELHSHEQLQDYWPPKLILTSPPYPGVHVLYHRWQIRGRRETAAPFWIANELDGNGESYYTFGSRKRHHEAVYFDYLRECFRSIGEVSDRQTIIAQVVGFSSPRQQLKRYVKTLSELGFEEIIPIQARHSQARRVWRKVPSRRWYADQQNALASAREVVLFHRGK